MLDAIYILIISALPIIELRGSIPYGLLSLDLPPVEVFLLAVIGNLIPVIFLLTALSWCEQELRKRSKIAERFFGWWFDGVARRNERLFTSWGAVALIVLVAIPLPLTGAWTGSVAAHLFHIKRVPAFFYIAIGVIIAGGIVTLATLTGSHFF